MKYIDAEALKKEIAKAPVWTALTITEKIGKTPTVDIVRCQDCKYWIDNLTEDDTDEAYGECCFDWDIKMPKADDFCSYGERERER